MGNRVLFKRFVFLLLLAGILLLAPHSRSLPASDGTVRAIVQAASTQLAADAVVKAGGTVLSSLQIIEGVSAEIPQSAVRQLQQAGLAVFPDAPLRTSDDDDDAREQGTRGLELYPSAAVGSYELARQGLIGQGITIAYVDSGFPELALPALWQRIDDRTLRASHMGRFVIYRDLMASDRIRNSSDPYGHGTHVVMTVSDSRRALLGRNAPIAPIGVAPGANIVMVRAMDAQGQGSYGTTIEAIDWIVANKHTYGIRVLNLSLEGDALSPYWADPLNQAVMRAWAEGIVVVAAAGNRGPAPMTISVPGNVPYVITVGAIKSGRYTTTGYDELASYSSSGPTESKFVKPDILVPASQTIAVLPRQSTIVQSGAAGLVTTDPLPILGLPGVLRPRLHGYYKVSGTSMAAAEVSGIVALMLQQNPSLTNDQVKHRLMATASPAGDSDNALYSVWQQGAGRVNTVAAVTGTSMESANPGMAIGEDKLGNVGGTHYVGLSEYDQATGQFYLENYGLSANSYVVWNGGTNVWNGGTNVWNGGTNVWNGGTNVWNGGTNVWNGGTNVWNGGTNIWNGNSVQASSVATTP